MDKSLEIDLQPDEFMLQKISIKAEAFFNSQGFAADTVRSQITIIEELLKNAIACAKFSVDEIMVKICVHITESSIIVELKNPVNKSTSRLLEELDKTIQWIRGYQDPFEPYIQKLIESSCTSCFHEINALGLARIAYEENALLDFFVNENNILSVSATKCYR